MYEAASRGLTENQFYLLLSIIGMLVVGLIFLPFRTGRKYQKALDTMATSSERISEIAEDFKELVRQKEKDHETLASMIDRVDARLHEHEKYHIEHRRDL